MRHKLARTLPFVILLAACQPAPAATPESAVTAPPAVEATTPSTEIPADVPASEAAEPTLEEQLATLDGLDIDSFFEESFQILVLRWPQFVVEQRLDKEYGIHVTGLNDVSDDYARETSALAAGILERLHSYDRAALDADDQVSYDVYEWYLADEAAHADYLLYEYPATFMLTGVHLQNEMFFADNHPLETAQDARDYVDRLWLVDDQFAQLSGALEARGEAGISPPGFVYNWTLSGVSQMANGAPTSLSYYTTLRDKIADIDDLSADEQTALLDEALQAVTESVIPAYQSLGTTLTRLQTRPAPEDGVGQFAGGDAYYAWTLHHHTTGELTADEIHALGLQELVRIHAEMRTIFDELDYPADASLPALYQQVAIDGGSVPGSQMLATFTDIITEAEAQTYEVIPIQPAASVIVRGDQFGGFYVPAALDGSRPGVFYANVSGQGMLYRMRSLAYHEAVPGHHTQLAIQQETDLPTFRKVATFTGYVEGWALYAERLAYELGWYDDDPYGNLGRLQFEAYRAARLVVDTGIHSQGWSFDEAVRFFVENVGFSEGQARNEIGRYVVWPGQATAYMVGMLDLLRLRAKAEAALGDDFDLAAFHRLVLGSGSMPLDVLERVVEDWIAEQQ